MKKKVVIGVIIAVLVIAIGIGACFIKPKNNNTNNNEPTKPTLNLTEVSNNITNEAFYEMYTQEIDTEILSSYYGVNLDNVEEVIGKMPRMNVHASMYILVKAVDGQAETVKQELEEFGAGYEQQWERYLPEQYDLVQNRKIGTVGNYVYLIISEKADELVSLVK